MAGPPLSSSQYLSSVGCLVCRLSSVVVVVRGIDASIAQNLQCMPTIELGRFSLLSFARSLPLRSARFFLLLLCGIMRIRKGPRCVPLSPAADRWCLVSKGFAREDNNAQREDDDDKQRNGGDNQVVAEASGDGGGGGAAAAAAAAAAVSVAATSGCCHDNLDHHASSSAGTMERLEVDRVQRKRLTSTAAAGYSRRRRARGPIAEGTGVISISSIIKAGVKSTKVELFSAESVITLVAKSPSTTDWTPAMKSTDQPSTRLLQSLKRVCSAAESTGLTAKEAVAKIQEQGLPGLIDGGERLIVQVAKSLRSSSAFVEREERGRYFIQEPSDLDEWDNFQTTEEAVVEAKSAATDFDTVIEAAKQLQKLQEPIKADPNKPTAGRWTLALRGKSTTTGAEKVEPAESNLSGPRCNRDDGKGWRCVRMAESGFSLCKYHRDQIRRAEIRRRKARTKSKKHHTSAARPSSLHRAASKPSNPTSKEEAVKAAVPEAEKIVDDSKAIDSDNELPDHKRRRFVKAKSLKSLL